MHAISAISYAILRRSYYIFYSTLLTIFYLTNYFLLD